MDTYKVGGLFSGVGGIELGFEKAGFEISWANEIDLNACKTYRGNFKDHLLIEDDIWNIIDNKFIVKGAPMPPIDVLVGGFPCQAFSIAGYRKGFEDPRGNLFFAILKFIKHFKPKVILLENVKNLQSHDNGNTLKRIIKEMHLLGYSFIHEILNSYKYTAVCQNRERVFMVCFKDEAKYNEAGYFNSNDRITFNTDNNTPLSNNFSWPEKINREPKKISTFLERDIDYSIYQYTKEKYPQYWDMLSDTVISKDHVYQLRRVYVRRNESNVCPTLTAGMGLGGHNVPIILDPNNKIRKLTPRECFSFQGYPKSFKLPDIANTHLYKQAGNSVTVPLITNIAKNIKVSLDCRKP